MNRWTDCLTIFSLPSFSSFGTIMFPVPSPDELDGLVEDDIEEDANHLYSSPSDSSDASIHEEKRGRGGDDDALDDEEEGVVQIIGIGSGRGRGRGRGC